MTERGEGNNAALGGAIAQQGDGNGVALGGATALAEAAGGAGGAGDDERLIGSLGDLAAMAGMPSEPTIKKMIDGDPEFPVLSRGTNGRSWEFDLRAAWQYIRDCQRREEERARAHKEKVAQLGLDLLGDGALVQDLEVLTLTPQEQNAAMNAEYLRTKMAEKRRTLVPASEVVAGLADDAAWFVDQCDGFSGKCAKRGTFNREQLNVIDQVIDELRTRFAERLEGRADSVASQDDTTEAAAAVSQLS